MMVLSDICKKCNKVCYSIHFQQNFNNWTSGNDDINKFIQNTQLSSHKGVEKVLEWIPYNKFYDITYIADERYCQANWVGGNISYWNSYNQNWERKNKNMNVKLKLLNNSTNITLEFVNKV
jgi:hypothetical protein